jgi:outer membrane protein
MPNPTYLPSYANLMLAIGLITMAPVALAQSDTVQLQSAAPGKDGGRVGLAAVAAPRYQGSDQRGGMLVPLLEYQWANGWFAGFGNGVGYNFSQRRDMQYGLRVTADFGRSESRASALHGMGDIEPKPQWGAFANAFLSRDFALNASVRYGAGVDNDGAQMDVGASYSTALAPQWRLSMGLAATMANASYMRSYFGVTPAQAAATRYTTYTPDGGLRDARASLFITHQINPRTYLTAGVSASALADTAKSSPLTREASTVTGLLAASYTF